MFRFNVKADNPQRTSTTSLLNRILVFLFISLGAECAHAGPGHPGHGFGPGPGMGRPGWGPGFGPRPYYGPFGYGMGWGFGYGLGYGMGYGMGYPAYGYGAPVIVESVPPPIYIQNNTAGQSWYFCRSSNGYYPYVKVCPEGWENVPSAPR